MSRTIVVPWRTAGVMGLGLSGVAAAGFLARHGAAVVAADMKDRPSLSAEAIALASGGVRLEASCRDPRVFAGAEVVIVSPGVPPSIPPLQGARQDGIPVLSEVELGSRWLRGVLVGITGSNGKSTVTALTGRMLAAAGVAARVCGNIGTPLTAVMEEDLELPDDTARQVRYVTELSSFQLEGITTMRPRVGLLLNLSPDHQDRYAATRDYYQAKERLFMNQRTDDIAILNWDDPACRDIAPRLAARVFPFSLTRDLEEGALLREGRLVLRRDGRDEPVMPAGEVPIPGRHNLENVLAAAAAAAHCGAPAGAIAGAVAGFEGLPHRLERVGVVGGVAYVNDSKATNVGATLRAVEAFSTPLVLLLGGYDKGGDFESLRGPLSVPGRIRALVTFGKAGPDIARRLEGAGPAITRSSSMPEAVRSAAALAREGDTILLAPGCASFDAYSGFEKRGEDFRAIVARLSSQAGRAG